MKELKRVLGRELYERVCEKLEGKALMIDNGTLIPKHRFDCVNVSLKEHREKVKELSALCRTMEAERQNLRQTARENLALRNLVLELLQNEPDPKEEE